MGGILIIFVSCWIRNNVFNGPEPHSCSVLVGWKMPKNIDIRDVSIFFLTMFSR